MSTNLGRALAVAAMFSASAVFAPAHAALVNGSFETVSGPATNIPGMGDYRSGAVGWQNSGSSAGTFSPISGIYDANYGNVGVANAGEWLAQSSVGTILQAGGNYTVSGLFGNRNDVANFNGAVGFFVGPTFASTQVIETFVLSSPSVQGTLQNFAFTLSQALVNKYAGLQLGVYIWNNGGQGVSSQLTVDNLALSEPTTVPVPGAIWLFGSVLGASALRRRVAKQA